jgi:transcriptional regulator with XRE-family HTH domain
MRSGAKEAMPSSVGRSLRKLGADINIARRKRALSVEHVMQAAGISAGTLRRLEAGEPTVSIGALAMVLLSLDLVDRLDGLVDVATDDTGLLLDIGKLPARVTAKAGRGSGL